MSDLNEQPENVYLRHITPLTTAENQVTWNLNFPNVEQYERDRRTGRRETTRIEMAVNYYNTRNIDQLKNIIMDRDHSHCPTGLSKFSYVVLALFGRTMSRNMAKLLKPIPQICKSPLKLTALIRMLFHLYEPVLVDDKLPELRGAEQYMPNMDRAILETLPTYNSMLPPEVAEQYSIYTAAYLYRAILNTTISTVSIRIRTIENALTGIGGFLTFNPATPEEIDRVRTVVANVIHTGQTQTVQRGTTQQERVRGSLQSTVTNDPFRHLKEWGLKRYGLTVSHNIEPAEDCVICLEAMVYDPENPNEKKIRVTDCGHMFHEDCINKWRKNICPTCRNPTRISRTTRRSIPVPPHQRPPTTRVDDLRRRVIDGFRTRNGQAAGGLRLDTVQTALDDITRPNIGERTIEVINAPGSRLRPTEVRIERFRDLGRDWRPTPYANLDDNDS